MKIKDYTYRYPIRIMMACSIFTASDGTNVVKMFNEAIKAATLYKKNPVDIEDQILEELDQM